MQTFHRFADRAAFLAACAAAGWPCDPMGNIDHPPGMALDIIGPYAPVPTVVDGVPIPGPVDARWHVNALWPSDAPLPEEWEAARITPATPSRVFALAPPGAGDGPE
jgi:hypothetical protein